MKLNKLRVCVIDDEKTIRKELISALNESPRMQVVGEAESVLDAAENIIRIQPDAVFLDIKLRQGDAFQVMDILRKEMTHLPAVIINTGYSDFEYAQRIFNQYRDCVITILQKPFWEEWSEKEASIVDQIIIHQGNHSSVDASSRISIKSDYKTYVFEADEIMYMEVSDDDKTKGKVFLESIDKKVYFNKSLSELLKMLPEQFVRVSRFLIINMHYLDFYDHSDHVLYLKGLKRSFGVGSTYETNFLNALK